MSLSVVPDFSAAGKVQAETSSISGRKGAVARHECLLAQDGGKSHLDSAEFGLC